MIYRKVTDSIYLGFNFILKFTPALDILPRFAKEFTIIQITDTMHTFTQNKYFRVTNTTHMHHLPSLINYFEHIYDYGISLQSKMLHINGQQ